MRRIGYYYPTQAFIFTLGFYLTQLALSGHLKFWSGVALCLTAMWCIGVIMWNKRIELKETENDL